MENTGQFFSQGDLVLLDEKPFDLKGFLYKFILRYWYWYVLGLILGLAGAWTYLRYATPMYVVNTTILIKDESGDVGGSEGILLQELGLGQGAKNVINEIQILKTRTLMETVVERLKLNVTYTSMGRVRDSEVYMKSPVKVTFLDSINNNFRKNLLIEPIDENKFKLTVGDSTSVYAYNLPVIVKADTLLFYRNKQVDKFVVPISIRFRKTEDVAQFYANKIGVNTAAEWSSVLKLSLKGAVPTKAADVLNTLVEVYNEAAIHDKNSISANTLKFIEDRLLLLTDELSGVEKAVENFKRDNQIISADASVGGKLVDEVSLYERELGDLEVKEEVLNYIQDYFNKNKGRYELLPANLSFSDIGISGEINSYNQLILNRERLLRSATVDNPGIKEMEFRISAIEQNIAASILRLKKELRSLSEKAQQNLKRFQQQMRQIPRKERGLLEIARQQRIKENLYLYLLEKREETALSLAITVPNSRLLDKATVSKKPVEPKRQLIYATGLILGLGLPIMLIFLRNLLNDSIQSEADIKAITSTPQLGGIALSKSKESIVVKQGSRSAVAEMFRLLRVNLQFLNAGKEQQTILVTSGSSGEGKTFITINLGMSIALAGKKTLLIGLDLRKPKLSRYLDAEVQGKGITSYLVGGADEHEIIHVSKYHENLHYIPAGPIPPNPAELLMQDRLKTLIQKLKQEFDVIIFDTPPVGLVADSFLLNEMVDTSLFVLRFGETKKGVLNIIEDIYQNKKLNNPAIIMNGIKSSSRYGGYSYGYGYGYGYGYYEED